MIALMPTIAVHVLSGVFWAGTTFALARGQGLSAESLRKPQLGAAAVAVVSGALLGHLTHPGLFARELGDPDQVTVERLVGRVELDLVLGLGCEGT